MSSVDNAGPQTAVQDGEPDFIVISQRVELDVNFQRQAITGSTQIVAQPLRKDLKAFRLNFRQGRILRATVEGKPATVTHYDPYDKLKSRTNVADVHHHDYVKRKLAPHVKESPEPELRLALPPRVVVKELESDGGFSAARIPPPRRKDSEVNGPLDTPILPPDLEGPQFAPMKIYLEFLVETFRDGLHWVGTSSRDGRFPHVFTRNSLSAGCISSVFPCVDAPNARCMWELSISCPKTVGDAFRIGTVENDSETLAASSDKSAVARTAANELTNRPAQYSIVLSEEERALELTIVCSGELSDEMTEDSESTKRTVSFACATPVAARHIGFAIGPFESVDLSAEFRDADEEDKLGQNAVKVTGYCLPGRADELRNTCLPVPKAIDYFTVNYGTFPFPNYKVCLVDDIASDFADTAGLTLLSSRLLFPESIIDTLDAHTRTLVFALASQYFGVSIIAKDSSDLWAIVGIAGFMADSFMKKLAGNNEHRFRQKLASDRVFEEDVSRYSLHQLGGQLDIDPSEYEFMKLKAPLVLFILDRRLTKQSGSAGLGRIVTRIVLNAKTGDLQNGELTTEYFLRTCEKLGHAKLDSFFKQWVYNAGCPDFTVSQRFNKKKLVVEMTIQQVQSTRPRKLDLSPATFMREAKENVAEAYAPELQPAFVGPMTIRIHEADGTPYEHIVEVKDVITRFEIPYNTKYKRLKRSKKAKERSIAINGPEQVGESQDDVLLYCLGDTLQSEQEVKDWFLVDWTEQQENQMGQESYEWIRMDADFEWIGRMNLSMPIYMYVSQLQQDRDVVAQYESVQRIAQQEPHQMGSTILIRTLMDRRYFHGIRTAAAMGLTRLAVPQLRYLGLYHLDKAFAELYCFPDNTTMPRPNDFSDRASYIVQCTIPKAMAQVRDPEGKVPLAVRKFLADKIRFNDNTNNENNENVSDNFYLATLTTCLVDAVVSIAKPRNSYAFSFDDDDDIPAQTEDDIFRTEALKELERYRNSDEWTPSYQNVTTIAAIECIQKLVKSGVQRERSADILTYTRPENAANVRIKAFEALVDLTLTKRPTIMRYLLSTAANDHSPFVREQLTRVMGLALGSMAIGDDEDVQKPSNHMDVDSGLVLEQEQPADGTRAQEIARKSSPDGALAALRQLLINDAEFKESLWASALSTRLSIQEVNVKMDTAALLFDSSSLQGRLLVGLPFPRAWAVQHMERGVVRFHRSRSFRTAPSKDRPLTPKDFKLVKSHGLRYTGPVPREVLKENTKDTSQDKVELTLESQIANLQKEIERQQAKQIPRLSTTSTRMSPPPLPTPTEGALKLSLKRRPSVDIGKPFPSKMVKTGKGANTPITPSTPLSLKLGKLSSVSKSRGGSATPVSATPKAPPSRKQQTRVVRLRFPTKYKAASDILIAPSAHNAGLRRSQTPSLPSTDDYFPLQPTTQSPEPTDGNTAVPPVPTPSWNVGGFRNFGVSSALPQTPEPIKTETIMTEPTDTNGTLRSAIPPESPDDIPLAQQRREASQPSTQSQENREDVAPLAAAADADADAPFTAPVIASADVTAVDQPQKPVAPAPPTRKITLKFGKKAGTAGGAQSPT